LKKKTPILIYFLSQKKYIYHIYKSGFSSANGTRCTVIFTTVADTT